MASDSQKLDARLMLGVPLCEIEYQLDALNTAELAKLDTILAGFASVQFRAADVEVNGVIVKADKARQLYIDAAWVLLGACEPSFKIGRS